MATDTVKWFNPTKGYGFIQPQTGGKDVFVHISAVERAGLTSLNEGQTIQYDVVSSRGKRICGKPESPLTKFKPQSARVREPSRSWTVGLATNAQRQVGRQHDGLPKAFRRTVKAQHG